MGHTLCPPSLADNVETIDTIINGIDLPLNLSFGEQKCSYCPCSVNCYSGQMYWLKKKTSLDFKRYELYLRTNWRGSHFQLRSSFLTLFHAVNLNKYGVFLLFITQVRQHLTKQWSFLCVCMIPGVHSTKLPWWPCCYKTEILTAGISSTRNIGWRANCSW